MFRLSARPRRRHLRLLTTWLVALSLLVNALGIAYASAPKVMAHDCAQMSAHASGHGGDCCDHGKPVPGQGSSCQEQCMMRAASNTVLPSLTWMPLHSVQQSPSTPPLASDFRPLADSGPGLRPPIFA